MRFSIYHQIAGGHVHMRLFANGGKCGDMCMREDEFAAFRGATPFIQFVDEGEHPKPQKHPESVAKPWKVVLAKNQEGA